MNSKQGTEPRKTPGAPLGRKKEERGKAARYAQSGFLALQRTVDTFLERCQAPDQAKGGRKGRGPLDKGTRRCKGFRPFRAFLEPQVAVEKGKPPVNRNF